jgi:hypothetical protein
MEKKIEKVVEALTALDSLDADIFLLSGEINRSVSTDLIELQKNAEQHKNVILILATPGGDPDAAYKISRYFQFAYEKFILFVFGYCKSAGTLLALGANEIVMSEHGELGPLDVQIRKDDDLFWQSSGLDIFTALQIVNGQSFLAFEDHFLKILNKSGGTISTKTSANIAAMMAYNLMTPIMGQIDPMKLGEVQRAINIAFDYGKRLIQKEQISEECVSNLIYGYPSHGFVIDYYEAKTLFPNVRFRTPVEYDLELALNEIFDIWYPSREPVVFYLNDIKKTWENESNEQGADNENTTNEDTTSENTTEDTNKSNE